MESETRRYAKKPNLPTFEFVDSRTARGQIRCDSAASSYLIKSELLRRPIDPFDGSPGRFHMLSSLLKERMSCVSLTALEELQILFVNTTNRPQELVRDHLSVVTPENAESSLDTIWITLDERYGSRIASAQIMINRLKSLPLVKSIDDEDELTRMLDACRRAVCSMTSSPQLEWLNT